MTAEHGVPWSAATRDHQIDDRVSFALRSGDLRVERHQWVYYVTWVPEGEKLIGDWSDLPPEEGSGGVATGDWGSPADGSGDSLEAGLVVWLVMLPAMAAVRRIGRIPAVAARRRRRQERKERRFRARLHRTPSIVGVIRVPNPKRWKVDPARVMAQATVPPGGDRRRPMTELAARAAAGEFDAP